MRSHADWQRAIRAMRCGNSTLGSRSTKRYMFLTTTGSVSVLLKTMLD